MNPEEHIGLVYALAHRIPHDPRDRPDLIQQGCVGLMEACRRYDPERGAFSTWAVPWILGEMRALLRKNGAIRAREGEADTHRDWKGVTESLDLLPAPDDVERRVELRDILARLPDMDRKLVILRHVVGLTQQQAGQRLGLTQCMVSRREVVIRSLIRRAMSPG